MVEDSRGRIFRFEVEEVTAVEGVHAGTTRQMMPLSCSFAD